MFDRTWIKYNQDMIKCCTNEIMDCKKAIKIYQDFIKQNHHIYTPQDCLKSIAREKERIEKLKKEMRGYEIYLARWQIRKFQDDNGKFKVIKGGVCKAV